MTDVQLFSAVAILISVISLLSGATDRRRSVSKDTIAELRSEITDLRDKHEECQEDAETLTKRVSTLEQENERLRTENYRLMQSALFGGKHND